MRILVVLTVALSSLAVSTDPAPAGAAGPARCTQDWRPAASAAYLTPAGAPTDPPQPLAAPPAPTYEPYHLFCDGHYITTLWRAPVNSVFESVRLAHEIIAHAMYPSVHLGVNPARGLTGLASWFWADPDAAPLLLVHGNGPDLDVELRVDTVKWKFGDPSSSTNTGSGLGEPYPTPSSVAHTYERKGSYTVTAEFVIAGRYWYEELFDALPSSARTITLRHDVVEIRSLLHAR
jgi:hypothetical protein